MQEHFLTCEQSLAVKELGFDEPCLDRYDPRFEKLSSDIETWTQEHYPETLMIPAPLKSQFFKWVRDKYDIDREIYINHEMGVKFYHYLILQLNECIIEWKSKNLIRFDTYEQAEEACIDKIIELLKEN